MEKWQKIIICIVAVILVMWGIIFSISHFYYGRSTMATLADGAVRVMGIKKTLVSEEAAFKQMSKSAAEEKQGYKLLKTSKYKTKVTMENFYGVDVIVFTPKKFGNNAVIYLHGGAYVSQVSTYHYSLCDALAKEMETVIYMPVYPLAPNHTYKNTYDFLDQFYPAVCELKNGKTFFMGDSAGGGLALSYAEYLAENKKKMPDHVFAFSPWIDVTMENKDMLKYEPVDSMLAIDGLKTMGKAWAGELDVSDYRISPLFGNVESLCKVDVFVGTREICYPDAVKFYDKCLLAGADVTLHVEHGMNHDYVTYPIPEAKKTIKMVAEIAD